jgi:hypothetical protein
MRLEGWGQFKNPVTSPGIEPAAFRIIIIITGGDRSIGIVR